MQNKNKMQRVWNKIFGVNGCPAHVYPEKNPCSTDCKMGNCCFKCPEKKTCTVERGKCLTDPKYCSVGNVDREAVIKLFNSRKWRDYIEFTEECQRRLQRGKF